MTLLQRGCIKSVQFINQWVKLTNVENGDRSYYYAAGILQFNINQVNPTKSVVLFNDSITMNKNTSNSYPGIGVSSGTFIVKIHSIESTCVKFRWNRIIDRNEYDDWFYNGVFQVVEFY